MDAHLEDIQEELLRWEPDPPPTLRIALFDKSVLDYFYQRMSTVVSLSSTSVLNVELLALKHTMVGAKMIVSPVPDFKQNELYGRESNDGRDFAPGSRNRIPGCSIEEVCNEA